MDEISIFNVEEFSRYEFKYFLNLPQREEVEEEIRHFMVYDGHIHEDLEDVYIVRSLYFDNKEATKYYEKIDGTKTRRKFRIRTYGSEMSKDMPIYLEEKGRHRERTFKNRIRLKPKHLKLCGTPEGRFELLNLYPGIPLVERFVYDTIRHSSNPTVLVDYMRRPYMSNYDMNFRVTFDAKIKASRSNELFPSRPPTWIEIDAGYTIVEIKFFRRIPAWFHRILQAHNLSRLSISKFCRGMEVCGLAVNLE